MRPIVFALALAGCATVPGSSADLFAEETAGRTPGPAQACVDPMQSENVRVLNSQTLAYDRGPVLYVNRLSAACPGLEPTDIIIVESRSGGRFCRGDHIRGAEPGAIIPGPTCFLGDWVPYQPRS